jgi:hypothetical protein
LSTCVAFATVWVAPVVQAQALIDEPAEVFRAGNAAYEAGDYLEAISEYRRLVDAAVVDGDLYYNLGNAYYKSNDLGNAVLFYLRSLRVQPRNNDAKENLELVRSQLKDKQFVRNQNRLLTGIIWLHNNLSSTEMLTFASASYLALCLLGIVLILRTSSVITAVYRKVSIVSPGRLIGLSRTQDLLVAAGIATVLFVTSGISSYRKMVHSRTEAVVLADELPVFSSPTDDATLQFRIHEGTLVNMGEQRSDWIRIVLPGGMSGWVASGSIEGV